MSFGTAYFTPMPMGRDLDYSNSNSNRQSFHQRSCSGSAYAGDLFLPSKFPMGNCNETSSAEDQSSQSTYAFQDNSHALQYPPVTTFPLSPCPSVAAPAASLSPVTSSSDGSPAPAELAPTLATMASPISPMASFASMQPTHTYEDVMPYSYAMTQYQNQGYPSGNSSDDSHGSPQTHYYNYSPDPSGSHPILSSFPQRVVMNSLADQQYAVPNSPPSFYHSQGLPSPYTAGSHSPMSSGPYTSTSVKVHGSNPLALTPPTTPHYGFANNMNSHLLSGQAPIYNESFTLQSQPTPRSNRPHHGMSSSVQLAAASTFRAKKTPYERTPRSMEQQQQQQHSSSALGTTPAPRRFQCHECEKAFPTKGELASHSRCHLKVPAFMCGICGRPFKRRTDYVRHVRNVHEEVGRYGCSLCGERFGRLDKLKRHDKRGCGNDKDDDEK